MFPLIWVWKNVTWEVKVFRYFNVIFFDTPFGVLLASLYISFQKNQYFLMSRQSRHWDDDQFPTLTEEKIIWFVTAFFQEWKITQINFSSQNVSVEHRGKCKYLKNHQMGPKFGKKSKKALLKLSFFGWFFQIPENPTSGTRSVTNQDLIEVKKGNLSIAIKHNVFELFREINFSKISILPIRSDFT